VFLFGFATMSGVFSSTFRRALRRQSQMKAWLAAMLVAVAASAGGVALAKQGDSSSDSSATVAVSALPREAQDTQRLILAGGPFPYSKDGAVFGNRERSLPRRARGHYREYTVVTPGARNRGARRIVCGGEKPTAPEVCYYTADHYSTFRRIER
jgi:ribonuclease T1